MLLICFLHRLFVSGHSLFIFLFISVLTCHHREQFHVASLVVSHLERRRFHLIAYCSSASGCKAVRSSCFFIYIARHIVKLEMASNFTGFLTMKCHPIVVAVAVLVLKLSQTGCCLFPGSQSLLLRDVRWSWQTRTEPTTWCGVKILPGIVAERSVTLHSFDFTKYRLLTSLLFEALVANS